MLRPDRYLARLVLYGQVTRKTGTRNDASAILLVQSVAGAQRKAYPVQRLLAGCSFAEALGTAARTSVAPSTGTGSERLLRLVKREGNAGESKRDDYQYSANFSSR
jgi:hypothetical protein